MTQKNRCAWVNNDPLYIKYHDDEWGIPTYNDTILFEYLILEGAQAGLSWITILKKRENYRKAYDNFDIRKIANYDDKKVKELMLNTGIVRNKLKIHSSIINANKFSDIQKKCGSFKKYIWEFIDNKPIVNYFDSIEKIPAKTEISDKISKDLKKRGFKFIGSTIIYAFMQSIGMTNDHVTNCFMHIEINKLNQLSVRK
jgi:DNA-3-methyladenine glycosylase I